ncbi:hypothetical protein B0T17DRAFT_532774 [Bombardia bombarda]|uniref:non-specific serine/threonine protein kinase n=1 Tax=Bombardia bombarda TaxID=252184 RepID=A0AA39X1U4_9PEZI|nr:hypothetical protein B0T17DRAFT_532774 [Bombardia bombarda]
MLRRPPGHVAQRKYLLAFAFFLLQCLPLADAQQQHHPSSPSGAAAEAAPPVPLTRQEVVQTPGIHDRRKTTFTAENPSRNHQRIRTDPILVADDASAHALAPDLSVRAPPSGYKTNFDVGLSQHIARRSLEDWEVEDFVLLATVDGDLYANDRQTGHERWRFKANHPMVETRHFRSNVSVLDEDYDPRDHWIWVVEPTRDGELYLWRPDENEEGNSAGLTKLPWTMKKMIEEYSPHHEDGIHYNGVRKTTTVTLDADTGILIKEFGFSDTYINRVEPESCSKPNALADGDRAECSNGGTITLGRTEYSLAIHRADGSLIASLKYSEWGPNTRDYDLIQQHHVTKDNRYFAGQHDGKVYGFDFDRTSDARPLFTKKLASPVARVFDVLHRWGASSTGDLDLIALPQPPLPVNNEESLRLRNEKVFINQTEVGSWYALSGSRYPLILHAPAAPINNAEWWELQNAFELMDDAQLSKALIGTHPLPYGRPTDAAGVDHERLMLDGPREPAGMSPSHPELPSSVPPPLPEQSRVARGAMSLSRFALEKIYDLILNPAAVFLIIVFLYILYWDDFRPIIRAFRPKNKTFAEPQIELSSTKSGLVSDKELVVSNENNEQKLATEPDAPEMADSSIEQTSQATDPVGKEKPPTVTFADPPDGPEKAPSEGPEGGATKKKKAHRGRRGGVKHKPKNGNAKENGEGSQSREDEPPEATVEEVVKKAKQLGAEPKLEPDIITVPNGVEEVSGPILKMGSLEVNEEQQLGTGSNGTVVFAGKWDGRDVAVKRMLVQFNEIASQETKLLRESDDHPNVIRYYAQQQRAAFLYIALELCQASLADVISRPSQFRELAQAGERDLPGVLYQITRGLSHLHSLRIVHRDLKPQNILVNMGKGGRPRLLVSDFGLCKKLEGGQSSFGATTAHAAGTSGWRAPELLIDDDGPGPISMTLTDPGSSLGHSGSGIGSGVVGAEMFGVNARRVTRAIDIFSLGLVFFYVLTKGSHPFDCGDRYMREVNIRKGTYDLDALDALGDLAYEARDLIRSMLEPKPKDRPSAREVMAHPFFWSAKKRLEFLCDVSDYFEKEPRDPPSDPLIRLESYAENVIKGDFLKKLPKEFVDSLGKQRKYTGTRMLDLLRALRNKRYHYEDIPESLKKQVGPLPDGFLGFWTRRFPSLLIACWNVVYEVRWDETDRFRDYYGLAGLQEDI